MELRKVSEGALTITLGWTLPAGVASYTFFANSKVVSVASKNLKDGTPRKSVRFHKTSPGPPFHVVAVCMSGSLAFIDVGTYGGSSPPPPPPPGQRLAPRTYNKGTNESDPRFCVKAPGVTQLSADRFRDEGGYLYTADGLNADGGNWRDRNRVVSGLKPANEMDGRSACDPYGSFPPWPAESYLP